MPSFSANLSFLYSELPFLERFGAAAADGFRAVEYLGPYDHPKDVVANELARHGLDQVLFNVPSGSWKEGERGLGCLPDRVEEFRAGVETALEYAEALGCKRLNVLSGIAPQWVERERLNSVFADNLRFAAQRCASQGVRLLIEPINTRDIPGFFLSRLDHAEDLLEAVDSDNLFIQFDFYHVQVMHGDLIENFRRLKDRIAHVQIADNPGRGHPGTGELNYRFIFRQIDRSGYAGWTGCEYKPNGPTGESLGWMRAYGNKEESA